jgi:hypothetical protein
MLRQGFACPLVQFRPTAPTRSYLYNGVVIPHAPELSFPATAAVIPYKPNCHSDRREEPAFSSTQLAHLLWKGRTAFAGSRPTAGKVIAALNTSNPAATPPYFSDSTNFHIHRVNRFTRCVSNSRSSPGRSPLLCELRALCGESPSAQLCVLCASALSFRPVPSSSVPLSVSRCLCGQSGFPALLYPFFGEAKNADAR